MLKHHSRLERSQNKNQNKRNNFEMLRAHKSTYWPAVQLLHTREGCLEVWAGSGMSRL